MNKKNRKDKKQTQPKKDSFLQWYDRERRHSKLTFVKVLSAVLLLIACVVISQEWTIARLGDEASKYTEETYDNLKVIIEENVSNVAIDEKALRGKVDNFDISYRKDGSTILRCDIEDGFFTAEARLSLEIVPETGDYKITDSERNYHSVDEYLDHYWLVFRLMGYGVGIGAFLVIMLGWNGIIWATAFILKWKKAKQEKNGGNEEVFLNFKKPDSEAPLLSEQDAKQGA